MKRLLFFSLVVLTICTFVFPQETKHNLNINAVPFGTLPMGSSSDLFNFGYGIDADAAFQPAGWKGFGIGAGAQFMMLPIQTQNSLYVISAGAGPVYSMLLGDKLTLFANARVGYYFFDSMGWDMGDANGGHLMYSGGGGAAFNLTGPFSLGLGLSYDYYTNLYNGLGISLYARLDYTVTAKERAVRDYSSKDEQVEPMKNKDNKDEKGKGVELRDMDLITLFPVLYKYYDNHPIGTVRVKNFESKTAEDITVEFYMERYMDNPMEAGKSFTLKAGEETIIELYGLFTQDMMEITEGTKASARVNITYTMGGKNKSDKYNPVLEVNNRNALTWDDDQKIASFITAKDPDVLEFSKKITNWMQEFENPAVDENLQKGIVLFEALKSYGIRYEIDPATPFASLSEQTEMVDFIQFPKQTLKYTTGDCDDLTALYTSMLESVGVETAIITIPGHIYMAFGLKTLAIDARNNFSRPDEYIFREDKVWVPVEITMFQESFEDAWLEGAKEWRENLSKDQAMFYSTYSSWQQYQAVGFKDNSGGIETPRRSDVTGEFVKSMSRYVQQEIFPQESVIRDRMAKSNKKYIYQNKLAVLYARYGLYDDALETFEDINKSRVYLPALLNTGNIYFLQKDYETALDWYDRVLEKNASNKKALLGSARCNHELENYGTVRKAYQKLKSVDSALAQRFAYLDLRGEEAQRAADSVGIKEVVLWEEDE
jgi:tetratricopeptide (TPR) repeat protein